MDNQEAIKRIEDHMYVHKIGEYPHIHLKEALDIALEALQKQTPKKVVCDGDDESDYVYCPCCHEIIGSNDMVWDEFYYRNWKPMYCVECGQAMIWR